MDAEARARETCAKCHHLGPETLIGSACLSCIAAALAGRDGGDAGVAMSRCTHPAIEPYPSNGPLPGKARCAKCGAWLTAREDDAPGVEETAR